MDVCSAVARRAKEREREGEKEKSHRRQHPAERQSILLNMEMRRMPYLAFAAHFIHTYGLFDVGLIPENTNTMRMFHTIGVRTNTRAHSAHTATLCCVCMYVRMEQVQPFLFSVLFCMRSPTGIPFNRVPEVTRTRFLCRGSGTFENGSP